MNEGICALPLVIHRLSGHCECIDPDCTLDRANHGSQVPCQWSWQYAHGRGYMGRAFPKQRCPQCRHIPRSGQPVIDLAQEWQASG